VAEPRRAAIRLMFFRHLRFGLNAPVIDLCESQRNIMPTRTAKFVLLLLAIAVPLCAADPYVGTWKMDVPKSKYERGARPREQTVTITKVGTDLDHKVAGTAADGSKISAWFTIPSAEEQAG
jgi:hypothetical protein